MVSAHRLPTIATLAALLRDTIAADRFPLSPRRSEHAIKIEFYGHLYEQWTILGITLAAGI
jgi:hypothetical protein